MKIRLAGADPFQFDLLFNAYDLTNVSKPSKPKP
jgi:hypothetical protein